MSHLYGDMCIQRICEAAGITKINATENRHRVSTNFASSELTTKRSATK